MIKTVDLELKLGGSTILNKVSIEIPKQQITALIGPNGAGKSTLLHTISRLQKADSGTVLLDDRPITEYEDRELARDMSILRQESVIGSRLQVRELIAFGRYPHNKGRHTEKDDILVDKALAAFDLDTLAGRFLDTLSGGQRQRALLAMNFAQDAKTVLLDEPLNNLDLSHARRLMHLIQEPDNQSRTFVLVLHDLNYAARYADHIIAMKQGTVFAAGSTADIFDSTLLSDLYETQINIVDVQGRPMALTY
ncbi:ABC transporter ATP-binding protein [Leucothrix mucor]|uniref:iron ABC transporter ATP-binding protein n=1 Tax=Leucothrix mucor TaxID=45248 RepID=UPI0003B42974|nr:ATP-binding cassette domain-containing protein [Leucothrix mucor]